MPYRVKARRCVPPLLVALLALGWPSTAPAAPSHGERARIGAKAAVLEKARLLDRGVPEDATAVVATGELGDCRRLSGHAYRCAARYEVQTFSLTRRTRTSTCTETVAVTISHRERIYRQVGRVRAASLRDFACR